MRRIKIIAWGIASFVVVAITQPVPSNGQTQTYSNLQAQAGQSLVGQWVFETPEGRRASSCGNIPPVTEAVLIKNTNNQLTIESVRKGSGSYAPMLTGDINLSGNQFSYRSDAGSFTGTVSTDGNEIIGTAGIGGRPPECGISIPFRIRRSTGAVQPAPNPNPPNNVPSGSNW